MISAHMGIQTRYPDYTLRSTGSPEALQPIAGPPKPTQHECSFHTSVRISGCTGFSCSFFRRRVLGQIPALRKVEGTAGLRRSVGKVVEMNEGAAAEMSGRGFMTGFPACFAPRTGSPRETLSPGERVAKGRERGRVVAGKDKARLRSNQGERSRARASLPAASL